MKFFFGIILIALIAAVAEYFLPWWTIAAVGFLVSLMIADKPGRSFLSGFIGIAVFWLVVVLYRDLPNEHILSGRMAALFKLPGYPLFALLTVLLGSIVGGLSSWAGSLLRARK